MHRSARQIFWLTRPTSSVYHRKAHARLGFVLSKKKELVMLDRLQCLIFCARDNRSKVDPGLHGNFHYYHAAPQFVLDSFC